MENSLFVRGRLRAKSSHLWILPNFCGFMEQLGGIESKPKKEPNLAIYFLSGRKVEEKIKEV